MDSEKNQVEVSIDISYKIIDVFKKIVTEESLSTPEGRAFVLRTLSGTILLFAKTFEISEECLARNLDVLKDLYKDYRNVKLKETP